MKSGFSGAAVMEVIHAQLSVFFALLFFGGFCESVEERSLHVVILCFILSSFRKLNATGDRMELEGQCT